ncbi:4Fe-4S dicluster domain-containing protein [Chloroflexota bacterium]
MTKYGMLIDLESCTGCKACMTACKANNNIPFGEYEGREYYRIWPMEAERGTYPYVIRNITPMLCMQCQDPPCLKTCPIPGAIYRREDGIVLVDEVKCDGCKVCIPACPYGALYFRKDRNIVDKCTLCVASIEQGGLPECVKTCPCDAMFFGDVTDPESRVSQLIKEWQAKPLNSEFGTNPLVYYTPHAARLRGTVVNQKTGQVVRGASVTLQTEKDAPSAVTDSEGVFFFWNLGVGGAYSATITAEGFIPSIRKLHINEDYTDLGNIMISP